MKTILFDVDGVLADFVLGFTKLLTPNPFGTRENTCAWNFKDTFSIIDIESAWRIVEKSIDWWTTLNRLTSLDTFERINRLHDYHTVVFGTHRKGTPSAQGQTHVWLQAQGIENPNVICTKYKGEAAKVIQAHYAIDDKPENCMAIKWMTDDTKVPTKTYILDSLTNRVTLPKAIRRVQTVDEFLDDVEAGR